MLSVIIVDDERGIIELIKNLTDYSAIDIQIVGEAQNGLDAFDLILEKRPNFVITDIRMPGMSGIELIEKTHNVLPEILFAIISGYRDFEYAQSALKFGVIDYLLKPIKKNELNELFSSINERVTHKENNNREIEHIKTRLDSSNRMIRRRFMQDLLKRDFHHEHELAGLFHVEGENFCVVLVKLDYAGANEMSLTSITETICERFFNKLKNDCFDIEMLCRDSIGYFVMNYSGSLHESLPRKREYLNELLKASPNQYELYHITIAIGKNVSNPSEIYASFKTAVTALQQRIDFGLGKAYSYESLPKERIEDRGVPPQSDMVRILSCVESMDVSQTTGLIRKIIFEYAAAHPSGLFALYRLCYLIIKKIYEHISQLITEYEPNINLLEIRDRLLGCFTISMLEMCITDLVKDVINEMSSVIETQESSSIRQTKKYIRLHYSESITLESIAKEVFLNPNYLSTLFKKETGSNLIEYLTEVRVDESKKMLRETSGSISEIACSVGFSDAKYFSKVFTKFVGIKPIDYRNFYA
ncbi:MAG: response regulator [Holosporaceae bacterium]|jgi:two-component system response regulator YesN|nr:response regulator [Holosporaceae bacterium]